MAGSTSKPAGHRVTSSQPPAWDARTWTRRQRAMASTMRRMEGTAMAGKFGLDPHQLDDEALERELRHLYATREETFFHGSRQALLNHTERMLQLEREYANRFPERTKADRLRTRKGSRSKAGQPTGR
jgi:hypothetical protein